MYEYNMSVLKQQYGFEEIDLSKPKQIKSDQKNEDKKNNCNEIVDCSNMTIDQINEVINKKVN